MAEPERRGHELTHDELILKKITRLEVGLFGVEGTDSRGLAGDIRDFKASFISITTRVTAVETRCEERTAAGAVPCEPVKTSKKEIAKAGGYGGIGIVIGFVLDWLFTHFWGGPPGG